MMKHLIPFVLGVAAVYALVFALPTWAAKIGLAKSAPSA